MFPLKNTLLEYNIAEENVIAYRELCKKFSKTKSVFHYEPPSFNLVESHRKRRSNSDFDRENGEDGTKSDVKRKTFVAKKGLHIRKNSSEILDLTDIKTLQKHFVSSLANVSALDIKHFKNVKPSQVCASDSLVISDSVLIQACKKSEKVDDNIASIIGNLLLLPKMYYLSNKLAPSCCDALSEYMKHHPKISVTFLLVPFLQLCPETKEHHKELFIQLTEHCTSPLSSQLLHALSSRDVMVEADLDIFQHLCKKVDPQAESTHTAVLTFLGKAVKYYGLVKYGQCLLYIVKYMSKHIKDEETLQTVVNNHTSNMKKGIEIQLKKILRNK